MKKYQRLHVDRIVKYVHDSDMRIIAIIGPRQVGKTTIAQQAESELKKSEYNCRYVSFDDQNSIKSALRIDPTIFDASAVVDYRTPKVLLGVWENACDESKKSPHGFVLFLDEIQLISGWSNIVKGLWDRDRRENYPLRVVILGSAVWQMLVGRNESLVGRFRQVSVLHWSLREMMDKFDLTVDEYIFYGGYPGPFLNDREMPQDEELWREYITESIVEPVIIRDIISLTQIRKPALMRQLVSLVPYYSGQIMSYHKLIGLLQDKGNSTTIKHYLDLLSDAFLISTLSRYTPSLYLGITSTPKFHVLNTALMTAPSGYSLEQAKANSSHWGRIVESAVGAHLINTRRNQGTRIHYWRNDNDDEVDFVIARGPYLLGIEVKSGLKPSYRGINAFKDKFPDAQTMIVGTGGVSISEFLSFTTDEWVEQLCA